MVKETVHHWYIGERRGTEGRRLSAKSYISTAEFMTDTNTRDLPIRGRRGAARRGVAWLAPTVIVDGVVCDGEVVAVVVGIEPIHVVVFRKQGRTRRIRDG